MRGMRVAARGFLVLVVLFAGYAGFGAPHGTAAAAGRSPSRPASDLTDYLQPLLHGWNRAHPSSRSRSSNCRRPPTSARADGRQPALGQQRASTCSTSTWTWTAEFAGAGWIAPLDGARLPLHSLLPHVRDTATFAARLYAAPYVTNAGLLYYRKDLLDRAGVQPPHTWRSWQHHAATLAPRYGRRRLRGRSSSPTRG